LSWEALPDYVLRRQSSGCGRRTSHHRSSNQEKIDKALSELSQDSEGYVVDLRLEQNIKDFVENKGEFDHLMNFLNAIN